MKSILLSALITTLLVSNTTNAHEWKRNESPGDREALRQHVLDEFLAKRQATQKKEVRPLQLVSSSSLVNLAAAIAGAANAPLQSVPFQVFPKLELKWDDDFLYVGSNGLPDHNMMVGITAWQQQVPLPQAYVGENAWRIPLHPVPAKTPAQIEGHFLRGAIALAVNGIPIFNPQNNRGEVSYEIGELDQWGGHCGRADDYHYHIAPLHLQEVVGEGKPIAYALDGYPIYGLTEPDGSPVKKLDECHGHDDAGIGYHYHASKERPYLQSAFYGEVVEAGGQVDPQPRAQGVRPDTAPLRGAEITGFESTGENRYKLSYEVSGEKRSIAYEIKEDGTYPFEFDNGSEGKVSEVYTRRAGGGGGPGGPGAPGSGAPGSGAPGGKGKGKGGKGKSEEGKGMRPEEDSRPPRPEEPRPPRPQASNPDLNGDGIVSAREFADAARREFSAKGGQGTMPDAMARARDEFNTLDRNRDGSLDATEVPSPEAPKAGEPMARRATSPESSFSAGTGFVLTSPEVEDGGNLPADYTGDGSGATLPLEWKGAPSGTKSYALIMDHLAPGNEMKGYWTMWGIPADVTSLPKNVEGVGKLGVGFKGEIGYEPPHSQGPGAKTYVLHVYALSAEPEIAEPADNVNREVLLAAIEDKILAQADLSVVYTRGGEPGGGEPGGSKGSEGRKGMAPGEAQRPEQPGNRPQPPSAQGQGGPQGGQRKPWIQMHGAELDSDRDGIVTVSELLGDMTLAASKYDADSNTVITPAEIEAAGDIRDGAAFAGFIYRHASELDTNEDSDLSDAELAKAARFIFDSADQDHDGSLTTEEMQTAPNAPFGNPPAQRADQPPAPRNADAPPGPGMQPSPGGGQSAAPRSGEPGSGEPGGKGKGKGKGKGPDQGGLIKPSLDDTMKLNVYADNWFMLYVNGRLVAVDPIQFTPHNVVSVDILPEYPMTIAVLAKDNADPKTGMEYGTNIGDGGFCLKFADGTVTNATWKAKNFFHGPIKGDTANPQVKQEPLPENWWAVDFDDSTWANAKEYTVEEVDPKQPYFENDFEGAKFIWTDDLALDNTILFRTRIEKPDWTRRWNTKPDLDVTGAPLR